MALRDLTFKIFAQDKTGKAFDQVKRKLGGVDGAARTINDRMQSAGRAMQGFGARASIASAGALAVFRDSVALSRAQEKAERSVANAIETTGGAAGRSLDQLTDMASQIQKLSNFGDEEILQRAITPLLTFVDITGDTLDRTIQTAVDLSAAMDQDLKSSAIQLGKALADPVAGLSALSRVGVTFTDEQEDMIEALIEANKLVEAQGLILDAINAQGVEGAAEAQTDAIAQMAMAWGDLKEVAGGVVAQAFTPIAEGLTRMFEAFQSLDPRMQKFITAGGAIMLALGPLVGVLGLIVAGFAALGAAGGPIFLVVAAFSAVTAAAVAFGDDIAAIWARIREAFAAMPQWAQDMARGVASALNSLLNPFKRIRDAVDATEFAFEWMYDKVVGNSWVPDMVDAIGDHFDRLGKEMVDPATEAAGKVSSTFAGLERDVGRSIGRMIGSGDFSLGGLKDAALGISDNFRRQSVSSVVSGLTSGAASAIAPGGGVGGSFLSSLFSGLGSAFLGGLPGFNQGGTFTAARGRAGVDRNVAAFRVSNDEDVTIAKRGDGAARPVIVNIQARDVESFRGSQAQIGRQIGRAVAAGNRGS